MIFSHVNVDSSQWQLHWAEGFLPTTIKSHVVKIVITWSIRPDENNNIGLVYTRYCWWRQFLWRPRMRMYKVQKPCINSAWIAWLIHGFLPVKTWLLIARDTGFYAIIKVKMSLHLPSHSTLCMRAANALVSLRISAGSHIPLMLSIAIKIKISLCLHYFINFLYHVCIEIKYYS